MKTTPWTLRKNVVAVANKAEAAALTAAIAPMQAQILGLKTVEEAYALRASYMEMPKGPTPVLKRWRVFCLDLLAERIRELKAAPIAIVEPTTLDKNRAAKGLPPSKLAKAKAKQAASTDVLIAAAKAAGVGPTEPTPPEGPKGGGKKKAAPKKKVNAKAATPISAPTEGLSSEAALVLSALAKLLRAG